MAKQRELEDLGAIELDRETARKIEAMVEEADQDVATITGQVHVNFRWGREPLEIIRRAAALHGVPYQTCLKQVAVRQALLDLKKDAETIGVRSAGRTGGSGMV